MPAASTSPDPRDLVTPEAFEVSPELLGLPLASPRRRLAAILLDLVFIGIITVVTRSFALVLGLVLAVALVRASTRRTQIRGVVFDRARRFAIGCLGVAVGLLTLTVWAAVTFQDDLEQLVDEDFLQELGERGISVELEDDGGVTVTPPTDSAEPRGGPLRDELVESRDAQAVLAGVSLYSTQEALQAYTELLRSGADDPMDRELLAALEARIVRDLAADTLRALETRVSVLEQESRSARAAMQGLEDAAAAVEDAAAEVEDAGSGGLLSRLRGLLDDLGFGFGWAALYTTVLLAATNGQTLGKRLLGIRVMRLDGRPITWWVAFERAGGYAAGFATGLLGFAQVYWDANRQAIHDRIVGTVVVKDGGERVTDWEAAT